MKITLTLAEVKTIVASKLGITLTGFDLEIDTGEILLASVLAELEAAKVIAATGNKIGAIKAFRENALKNHNFCYGLWEAKVIVENLESAITVAKLSRDWPVPVRGSTSAADTFVWKK